MGKAMIDLIESQSTIVITVVVLCLCYMVAALVFALAKALSCWPVAEQLRSISPVTMTPLAVILGLLIAFLAARVWENVGHANQYIEQEAGALSKVILFANALPPGIATKVRAAVGQHIDFVVAQEWPAMSAVQANPLTDAVGLTNAMAALLSFTPTQTEHALAQQRAVAALEQAFEARRNRLQLSQIEIASVQWSVIVALAMLILFTIALSHMDKPLAMAVALFMFATAVGASLVLLMENDRPFAAGGINLEPTAFRQVRLN
jgi:hypothetical protein